MRKQQRNEMAEMWNRWERTDFQRRRSREICRSGGYDAHRPAASTDQHGTAENVLAVLNQTW